MSWARALRQLLDRGEPGSEAEAYRLLAAALDNGMYALELGAMLSLLEVRGPTGAALAGYCRALNEHRFRLAAPKGPLRPVVFPAFSGARAQPDLLALLALWLQRFGVPVLVHGGLAGDGRITAAHVLRQLGVMPCAHLVQIDARLSEHRLAFAPTALLAPGLGMMLALKSRLGFDSFARLLAKLLNPFETEALIVVPACNLRERLLLRDALRDCRYNALLLEGTEGEAFANPCRRPKIERVSDGTATVLFDAETGIFERQGALPDPADFAGTVRWIRGALEGDVPMPLPIVNQLACCLYGAGYTDDLNQAKAIAAVETASLNAA
jgi:anthranilate phosphoribosyltransferase